jgi:hypothetical protein
LYSHQDHLAGSVTANVIGPGEAKAKEHSRPIALIIQFASLPSGFAKSVQTDTA